MLLHWVLIVDAVLPHDKADAVGYHRALAAAVIILFMVEQVLMVIVLTRHASTGSASGFHLHDRLLFTVALNGRAKEVHVVPLMYGRLVTTIPCSLRLL